MSYKQIIANIPESESIEQLKEKYKQIIDNVSNIENLDNTTILKVLVNFEKQITEYITQQSGVDNILNVEFVPTENALTYADGVADYFGELKITLSGGVVSTKPCNIKFNITFIIKILFHLKIIF